MPSRGFFGFGAFSASWPSENSERKKSRPSNVGPRAFTFQMSFLSERALHLHARDDVEREVGEVELAQAVVGVDRRPALDGDVVAGHLEVLQLGLVRLALGDVALQRRGAAGRLAPGDASQNEVGVGEIGVQAHRWLDRRAPRPTVSSIGTSPCTM